jgi:hypothetical protein
MGGIEMFKPFPAICLTFALCLGGVAPATGDEILRLRQEFNEVAASIDTLVRLYGGKQLEKLTTQPQHGQLVPAGHEVVLIFWADDEAEIFLNDYRISDTRLTPTEVVVPELYLQENNILRAHCWDTDRVESGFMAGLYLRDRSGGLRRILVTEEGKWWTDGKPAEERFYTHAQPDIPDAKIIWGTGLFGEIWMEARFDGSALRRAARRRPKNFDSQPQERTMEAHEVVSRLVRLQAKRRELEGILEAGSSTSPLVRYQGYLYRQLAFTLGHAGPLAETQSNATSTELYEWAESLPQVQKRLIYRERRELKGVDFATPEEEVGGGGEGEEERRHDYQAPPERGPVEGGTGVAIVVTGERRPIFRTGISWGLVSVAVALSFYMGVTGRQWWRLFNGKVWEV